MEVFLLGLIRTGSKGDLSFDHRDKTVSQPDLIAGIDDGSIADSRGVGKFVKITSARFPMAVLPLPKIFVLAAPAPMAVLPPPVVFSSAEAPKAVF